MIPHEKKCISKCDFFWSAFRSRFGQVCIAPRGTALVVAANGDRHLCARWCASVRRQTVRKKGSFLFCCWGKSELLNGRMWIPQIPPVL